jgi:hypothetical protein
MERDISVSDNIDYVRRGRELRVWENRLEQQIHDLPRSERQRFDCGTHPLNGERRDLARQILEYERETKRRQR